MQAADNGVVTHEYTLLLGGRVVRGGGEPDATAVAWAAGTILAIGSDDEVRPISRGDSHFVDLAGATVIPLSDGAVRWPPTGKLELGGEASLAILRQRPTAGALPEPLALVVAGRLIRGDLPVGIDRSDG